MAAPMMVEERGIGHVAMMVEKRGFEHVASKQKEMRLYDVRDVLLVNEMHIYLKSIGRDDLTWTLKCQSDGWNILNFYFMRHDFEHKGWSLRRCGDLELYEYVYQHFSVDDDDDDNEKYTDYNWSSNTYEGDLKYTGFLPALKSTIHKDMDLDQAVSAAVSIRDKDFSFIMRDCVVAGAMDVLGEKRREWKCEGWIHLLLKLWKLGCNKRDFHEVMREMSRDKEFYAEYDDEIPYLIECAIRLEHSIIGNLVYHFNKYIETCVTGDKLYTDDDMKAIVRSFSVKPETRGIFIYEPKVCYADYVKEKLRVASEMKIQDTRLVSSF